MLCKACGIAFVPKRYQEGPRFCSSKCRAVFWRRRKAEVQENREGKVRSLLEEAMEILTEGEESS